MISRDSTSLDNHAPDLPRLILGSTSPFRAELLGRLGVPFATQDPRVDETPQPEETAAGLALRLASAKAEAVHRRHPDSLVLGADQAVEVDGQILGKPGDPSQAVAQLEFLSGREAIFHSAVAMIGRDRRTCENIPTTVKFRSLSSAEIQRYLAADQPFQCAGALRSERLGISLVARIGSDDPSALIGLPLITVAKWLRRAGFQCP